MPLNELLPKAAKLYGKNEAVICGDLRMNYRTLAERVWSLARGLQGLGLEQGDRVGIIHENCHIFLEAYFAAAHLGLILVPLNFRLSRNELAMILGDSQSRVLIAQHKFLDRVGGITEQVQELERIIWTQRPPADELEDKALDYALL